MLAFLVTLVTVYYLRLYEEAADGLMYDMKKTMKSARR